MLGGVDHRRWLREIGQSKPAVVGKRRLLFGPVDPSPWQRLCGYRSGAVLTGDFQATAKDIRVMQNDTAEQLCFR
jgi:hypothetical protein